MHYTGWHVVASMTANWWQFNITKPESRRSLSGQFKSGNGWAALQNSDAQRTSYVLYGQAQNKRL